MPSTRMAIPILLMRFSPMNFSMSGLFFKKFSQKEGSGSAGTEGLADVATNSGSRASSSSGISDFSTDLTDSGREASNSSIDGKAGFSGMTGSGATRGDSGGVSS